ncbi:S41 family peptidase [Oleiharenicola lentus]|uniref:S41 family peptidase n=1 Tax=Oleiharenicola lentus TaxID=2508720 RepID=UPI003F670F58
MPRFPAFWIFAFVVATQLFTGCVTRPTEYREPPALSLSERATRNTQTFDRVWELVNEKYFDANFRGVNWPAMREKHRAHAVNSADDTALYRVLNDLCGELKESHLTAISPRRAHEQRVDARALIGIRWRVIDGQRVVSDVMPGGAAAEAGVQTGWIAISRDGQSLDESDTFVTRLGKKVRMEFLDRATQPRSLELEPRLLNFQHLESRELAGSVRYLRFDRFDTGTMRWLSRELKTHRAAPAVVLDFRHNPGGNAFVLQVAVAEFFDHRVATGAFVKRDGAERDQHGLAWFSANYAGKVVILTSPASGSAAEIFSHVLQHHKRATVIGQKTAGAVVLSRYYRLPGGGLLQLPFQDYIGLDGQRLEGRGVTPDIATPQPTLEDFRTGNDSELTTALQFLAAEPQD